MCNCPFLFRLYNSGLYFFVNKSLASERDKLTSYKDITTYNNYYEFGTSKSDPHRNSQIFKTTPWEIAIEGEVEKPIKLSMEEISEMFVSEERVYRLRCVEGCLWLFHGWASP